MILLSNTQAELTNFEQARVAILKVATRPTDCACCFFGVSREHFDVDATAVEGLDCLPNSRPGWVQDSYQAQKLELVQVCSTGQGEHCTQHKALESPAHHFCSPTLSKELKNLLQKVVPDSSRKRKTTESSSSGGQRSGVPDASTEDNLALLVYQSNVY